MKLWTKEIEEIAIQNRSNSCGKLGMKSRVIVKYFNPYGRGVWLITEAKKQSNGDWLLYGYCNIFYWEWGSVLLSDLQKIKFDIFGQKRGLERDPAIGDSATVEELVCQFSTL